jgi:Zn-dependent membrane protease YugP
MIFDPLYMVIMIVGLVIGGIAQLAVKGAFSRYSRVRASSNVTGAQAARLMLDSAGLSGVRIERVGGVLSDHYDPRGKVIRLSPDVHDSRSVAALGVACHEAGHAIQDARRYAPLVVRNAAVPLAGFGSNFAIILVIIGIVMMGMQLALGYTVAIAGVLFFAAVVFFQVVNLPVEFDASARAKKLLPQLGLISGPAEMRGVNTVLNAAAMTYVAGTVVAIMQLLYWLSVVQGSRR